jgi:S-adenosylhomocysteine hydrolase
MDMERAERFYGAVIQYFSKKYPRFRDENAKLILVIHAFEDKLPLVKSLLRHDMLAGIVLKKSSSEMQATIAKRLIRLAKEYKVPVHRSTTVYNETFEWLDKLQTKNKIVVGDHGGYFGHYLEVMANHFSDRFLGCTEHTLNGEVRHTLGVPRRMSYPYVSTARGALKLRSDRDIAQSIAEDTVSLTQSAAGLNLLNPGRDASALIIGYGTMGMHCAKKLKRMGCRSNILVHDINPMKIAFAKQDDFDLAPDLDEALLYSDAIIMATDTVKGRKPVLSPSQFGKIKKNACLTSVTSFTDEARHDLRMQDGTIRPIGLEGSAYVYETAGGNRFNLLLNGRPTNTARPNGGVEESILMVEASGIAGAFYVASLAGTKKVFTPTEIPLEDCMTISRLWLEHIYDVPLPLAALSIDPPRRGGSPPVPR